MTTARTGKCSPEYFDLDGKLRRATAIITMGREDYYLFLERYNIIKMEILDGCYFVNE